ncbi:MAG: hypothetical protein ACI94Y_003583 [Maribacter sp.]|jgi:hypothetical protein
MKMPFTYGMGVNDDESYPYLVDQQVNNYKIYNKATPGYSTVQNLLQFKKDIQIKKPTIVILSYYNFHDERNIFSRKYRSKLYKGLKSNPTLYRDIKNNVYKEWNHPFINSKTGELNYVNVKNIYKPFPFSEYSALINLLEESYNQYLYDEENAKHISQKLILEMSEISEMNGIPFYLALMEHNTQIIENYCKENNIKTLDASLSLEQEGYRNTPYDMHPSPLAHSIYAKNLHDFFKSKDGLKIAN